MTEILLSVGPLRRVLEIGTGSGYQSTVLSQLVDTVFSVERIEPLLKKARDRFRTLGINNIYSSLSDGSFGWNNNAPFDGIISTAAPQTIPEQLLRQLAPNGILVIPVGNGVSQNLSVIRRVGDSNEYDEDVVEKVKFVPLLTGVTH
jgi:protein-L-isoaspartate(D-aspartate) O-methyltransferase